MPHPTLVGGPPLLERMILDRCVQALPSGAKRYSAEQGPRSVKNLIALLENHQVTQEMLRTCRSPSGPRGSPATCPAGSGQGLSPPCTGLRPPQSPATPLRVEPTPPSPTRNQERGRCFSCGQPGHMARDCPGREETMPTADTTEGKAWGCNYFTTSWAHQGVAPPRLPVKIGGRDMEALLDSGSAITLVRPEFAGGVLHPR